MKGFVWFYVWFDVFWVVGSCSVWFGKLRFDVGIWFEFCLFFFWF